MHNKFYHLELSHYSQSNKYIIFIGDSFTWGQGLYLSSWYESRPEIFQHFYEKTIGFDAHLKWIEQEQFFRNEDIKLKNSLSFTNLVAKKLDRSCYKARDNGGSNNNNLSYISKFNSETFPHNDVIIIFQFTSVGREDLELNDEEANKLINNNVTMEDVFKDKFQSLFNKIDNKLKDLEIELGWKYYYMDWLGDFYDFQPDKFIKFGEGNVKCIDALTQNFHIKIQYKDMTFYDYHLNSEGNILVADSIIKHIQKDLENS
ncbi:hypothetical protein EB155_08755 [archaeon]|nr:hypothetical protein [archaeon]NDB55133.1 hypothetical protein [archaeon]NDB79944.1 hypothetical protein [archaeon]